MSFHRNAVAWLIILLVSMPACRAYALKIERFSHFSPASGKTYSLEVAAGSAIVRFKAGVSSATASAALAAAGFTVDNYIESLGWAAVGMPAGMSVSMGIDRLKNIAVVGSAGPNRVFRPSRTPNDPLLSSQYALAQVQAFGAWEYETGFSSRVTVAVIDTGIDGSHPELSGKLAGTSRKFDPVNGNVLGNDDPPTPACNHATRAAGVAAAAADNSSGVAGISWGAKLISLKVFDDASCDDDCSNYSCATSELSIAAAINDVKDKHDGADLGKVVINLSLGSPGGCSTDLQNAVTAAVTKGAMLFAASGNDGAPVIDSPANCAGVVSVGATDLQDNLASFSNIGTEMITRGLTAPGVSLYTTDLTGGYASASGTSFSSPLAAGLAALVWSAKPSFNSSQVFDTLKNSADDLGAAGPDRDFGWGRVNALKALRLAVTGTVNFAGTNKAVAYPNPFRPKTQRLVSFTISEEMTAPNVEVKVYTSEGELVKKLEVLAWDGKNDAGAAVASGVYLFRVKTDKDAAVGKFALIR